MRLFDYNVILFDIPSFRSAALKGIVAQSKAYADAIKFSIHAAHCSHSLAQEAINFADKRLNPRFLSTKADQLHYLRGMAAVAHQGKEKAGKVLHEFTGVSSKVSTVGWSQCQEF